MKKVEHYICEVCGTEYNEKQKAVDCEKGHHEPKSIVKARYQSVCNDQSGYPDRIDVKMDDGKIVTYKR